MIDMCNNARHVWWIPVVAGRFLRYWQRVSWPYDEGDVVIVYSASPRTKQTLAVLSVLVVVSIAVTSAALMVPTEGLVLSLALLPVTVVLLLLIFGAMFYFGGRESGLAVSRRESQ